MGRIAAIAVVGLAGAGVLASLPSGTGGAGPGASVIAHEAPLARLCLGPARVALGGVPFAAFALGGAGCSGAVAGVVGLEILRAGATAPARPAGVLPRP